MKSLKKICFVLFAMACTLSFSQDQELNGLYYTTSDTNTSQQELKIHGDYLILSVYHTSPAKFIKTMGGFFSIKNDSLHLNLEFNSNYAQDSLKRIKIPIQISQEQLALKGALKGNYAKSITKSQELDGPWLFGTRGPDTGQKRRGDSRSRKTLKFLLDGRFQWIAFDTEGMQFKGSGGGRYTAVDGTYTENIAYFSRDNTRVGAVLEFNYELKENDWHHTGNNSKGEPMYEIWQRRE